MRDTEAVVDLLQRALTLMQERIYEVEVRVATLEVRGGDPDALRRTLERHTLERRAIA